MSGAEGPYAVFRTPVFLSEPVVVVAVSGGSDSTALLLQTRDHFKPSTRLVAVTVDHMLRPGSAAEAADVARLCAGLGIEHRTVRWNGDKPASGLQAAARNVRYQLLGAAARDLGGRLVLTGHTADDQAETVFMRRQRGEGLGLAGIAPFTLYGGNVWFARPQLGQRRAALREGLRARAVGWIDDPSNENALFERVRARRAIAALDTRAFDDLTVLARRSTAERMRLGEDAANLIDRHARMDDTGITVEAGLLAVNSGSVVHVLRILLATVGGLDHLPDLARSHALFERLAAGDVRRASLGRVVISRRRSELTLVRERRRRDETSDQDHPACIFRSPWEQILTSFDLAPACAVAKLIGKTPPPALPWP